MFWAWSKVKPVLTLFKWKHDSQVSSWLTFNTLRGGSHFPVCLKYAMLFSAVLPHSVICLTRIVIIFSMKIQTAPPIPVFALVIYINSHFILIHAHEGSFSACQNTKCLGYINTRKHCGTKDNALTTSCIAFPSCWLRPQMSFDPSISNINKGTPKNFLTCTPRGRDSMVSIMHMAKSDTW